MRPALAINAFAKNVSIVGAVDVHMEAVMTKFEQWKNPMIELIPMKPQERHGVTGTSQGNRHIGAVEVLSIRRFTAKNL